MDLTDFQLPPDHEVLANAIAARAELRAQIDQQLRTADSIDTKATALLTGVAAAVALVAGRLAPSTSPQVIASVAFGIAVLAFLVCCLQALSSRADFSYGADPGELVSWLESTTETMLAISLARALQGARDMNVSAINGKHAWYMGTVATFFLVALSIAVLFAVGAIHEPV